MLWCIKGPGRHVDQSIARFTPRNGFPGAGPQMDAGIYSDRSPHAARLRSTHRGKSSRCRHALRGIVRVGPICSTARMLSQNIAIALAAMTLNLAPRLCGVILTRF